MQWDALSSYTGYVGQGYHSRRGLEIWADRSGPAARQAFAFLCYAYPDYVAGAKPIFDPLKALMAWSEHDIGLFRAWQDRVTNRRPTCR